MPKKMKFKNADKVEYELLLRKPHKKHKADGLCDCPNSKKPKVWVSPHLGDKDLLDTLIHELTHAHFFDKKEREVRKFAANLTRFIYLLGWERSK